ncbi:MAG: transporter associated domain-containing protein, partial [Acidobacteriota bacterium]|nr:transporter associated domain-containing protein [Acidobacteriota bacterium]
YLLLLALYPVVRVTGSLARLGLSWLGYRRLGPERTDGLSEEEVRSLLLALPRSPRFLSGPFHLIWRILDLPRHPVDEIMIPRHRVQLLGLGMSVEQIAATLHTSAFSRFPVYQDRIDNIVGVLYAKDFWGAFFRGRLQRPEDVAAILRPPLVVTSGARIDSVLREMQKRRIHIAVVFDEYGRFEGIVTMEDIIEEIVGEIEDEFDVRRARREPPIQRRADDVWEAIGSTSIKELNEALPEPLPESPGYATLAGFLIAQQERIPEQGEVVEYPPYRFEVLDRQGPRLQRVRIVKM